MCLTTRKQKFGIPKKIHIHDDTHANSSLSFNLHPSPHPSHCKWIKGKCQCACLGEEGCQRCIKVWNFHWVMENWSMNVNFEIIATTNWKLDSRMQELCKYIERKERHYSTLFQIWLNTLMDYYHLSNIMKLNKNTNKGYIYQGL